MHASAARGDADRQRPLRLSGGVNEQDIRRVKPGRCGTAVLAGGEKLEGSRAVVLRHGRREDAQLSLSTSRWRSDGRIPAGLSARVIIPVSRSRRTASRLRCFRWRTTADVGVKFVGADDHVVFTRAKIVRADGDAVWVSGLPENSV